MESGTGLVLLVAGGWYLVVSVVSIAQYWLDKRAAVRGGWRISERTLLVTDLLGGWPGGLLARRWLRHKTRKGSYRLRFALVVAVHIAIWAAFVAVRIA